MINKNQNVKSSWTKMKHMCIICLNKFKCMTNQNGYKYLTMCDECLISIPLRHFKDLPRIPNYRNKKHV
jgi:hypothetical protein